MSTTLEDVTSLRIILNELKSKFDRSMRQGETFANLKEIYLQIKELECLLNAMQWNPRIPSENRKEKTLMDPICHEPHKKERQEFS